MACSICRPFVLYNDFLPPTQKEHESWKWLAFGYYDGITVGGNLFDGDTCDLKQIWNDYVKHGKELDGTFSSQTILGFRYEEKNEVVCDDKYWSLAETSNEYPFMFVSLIQIEKFPDSTRKLWEKRKQLEEQLNANANIIAITYNTLDNSDIIIVFLCKNYADGVTFIDKFHCNSSYNPLKKVELTLRYSYTVGAISKRILNEDALIGALQGKIPCVYIHVIEKYPGSIDHVYSEIKSLLGKRYLEPKVSVLGCNDELIILKDIPWNKFSLLYQDKKGLLNHSNSDYRENMIGVTTIIVGSQNTKSMSKDGLQNSNSRNSFCGVMRDKCSKLITSDKKHISHKNVCWERIQSNLYQIINALQKFETTPFADYLFQSAMFPVNMVLDMSNELIHSSQITDYFNSFFEFMKGFNLYIQNSGRSDRQFTQMPDFNVRFFNTPVKLNAFYNAFVYYLKQFLNQLDTKEEVQHEYEFLSCPSVISNMRVLELFRSVSKSKRLFLVEIPENQVYSPKMMMVMLSHEVGHFVGTNVRNREMRFLYIKKIMARIIVNYVRLTVKGDLQGNEEELTFIQNEEYWKKTEQKLESLFNNYTDDNAYENYIQNIFIDISSEDMCEFKDLMKSKRYHSVMVKLFLIDRIRYILLERKNELWDYIAQRDMLYWIKKGNNCAQRRRDTFRTLLWNCTDQYCGSYDWNRNMFSLRSSLSLLLDILKECIADLIGIMTIRIPMCDYLNTIIQSASDQGYSLDFTNKEIIIRSALVTHAMTYIDNDRNLGYIWTDGELERITDINDSEMDQLRKHILNFIEDYLDTSEEKQEIDTPKQALDCFLDYQALEYMLCYLLKCKETYAQSICKNNNVYQEILDDMYKIFDKEGEGCAILKLHNHVDDYLREVYDKLDKYAQKNNIRM